MEANTTLKIKPNEVPLVIEALEIAHSYNVWAASAVATTDDERQKAMTKVFTLETMLRSLGTNVPKANLPSAMQERFEAVRNQMLV